MSLKKAVPLGIVFGNSKSKCSRRPSGIVTVCSNTITKGYSINMKTSSLFIFCTFLLSCAAAPAPVWVSSPEAMRLIYPDSQFIAQQGRGAVRAAAEANGAAQIALFFNSQISSHLRIAERESIRNGNTQSSTEIEAETFVSSQIHIFGIRYAQDPYYDSRYGEWVTVAYINRDEAWQVYAPRFRQQALSFSRLFTAAQTDTNPFSRTLRYTTALNYARTPDFQNADIFGQLLHPVKMNEEFASVRAQIASLPELLDTTRRNASVYIDCPGDFESLITNAFSREFSAMGFPVASSVSAAAAICKITINEGMQQRDLGIFYHPSLQAVISSNTGDVLYTFNTEGERASAVTPDVAKRRAFQSLAAKVREGHGNQFSSIP